MKYKVLFSGDGVAPTGFATVLHSIIRNLPRDEFEIHHLAVNYFGDPHPYDHLIYPAALPQHLAMGDAYGYERIKEFAGKGFDAIFILNDAWIIDVYLRAIKDAWKDVDEPIPQIIVYFPVDGGGYTPGWFNNFDIVTKAVVYTEFAKQTVQAVRPDIDFEIIPHGSRDKKNFYNLQERDSVPLARLKQLAYPQAENLWEDSFIVLNANRNQPRKRLDLSLMAFALFAENKPDNVCYYHHAGIIDVGWNILELAKRLERELGIPIRDRIILTNLEERTQKVSMETLNMIYNSTDVGLNTGLGEGWGLTQTEHGSLYKPQVVGDHSATGEIFGDTGVVVPVTMILRDQSTLVERYLSTAEDFAEGLEKLYSNKDYYNQVAKATGDKLNLPEYDWEVISETWTQLLRSTLR